MFELATIPPIDWGATGNEAIRQNVAYLLALTAGTAPLHRDVGVDHGIGDPMNVAKARMSARVARAFSKHLPQVKLTKISWEPTAAGVLRAKVVWRLI